MLNRKRPNATRAPIAVAQYRQSRPAGEQEASTPQQQDAQSGNEAPQARNTVPSHSRNAVSQRARIDTGVPDILGQKRGAQH